LLRGDEDVVIPLRQPGYHQLGNPYPDTLSLADLRVRAAGVTLPFRGHDMLQQTVWVWDGIGQTYASADTFPIRTGSTIWVRLLGSEPVDLVIPPAVQAGPEPAAAAVAATDVQWTVQVRATQESERTIPVTLGVGEPAEGHPHRMTAAAPPEPPFERLTLAAQMPGAGTDQLPYQCLISAPADSAAWDLVVGGAQVPGEVQLEATSNGLPVDLRLVLSDPTTGFNAELRPGAPVTVAATSPSRRLRLAARPRVSAGTPSVEMVRLYPSPFQGSTGFWYTLRAASDLQVRVYDVAGREVRLLEHRQAPAGETVLIWDGRDGAGRAVGPGVYLARCRMGALDRVLRVVRLP
jgi:hypothetical protein